MTNLSLSILFVLLYGDIFHYPYTADEIISWLPRKIWTKKEVQKQLRYLVKKKNIFYSTPFYTINGHTKNISLRLSRKQYAVKKWEIAVHASSFLRLIPTISFVGITGGLSILNTDKEDDIDFYICAKNKTLWITRFLSTILMEVCAVRRRPGSRDVKDTICLNMFVSEEALGVPQSQQDVYTAHEVLQMRLLWERGKSYAGFLEKNTWVALLFPYKWREVTQKIQLKPNRKTGGNSQKATAGRLTHWSPVIQFMYLLDKPAKYVQLWYMKKRRTSEVVSDTIIRFHPRDARLWIFSQLQSKLQQYHLPLDKKIFHP